MIFQAATSKTYNVSPEIVASVHVSQILLWVDSFPLFVILPLAAFFVLHIIGLFFNALSMHACLATLCVPLVPGVSVSTSKSSSYYLLPFLSWHKRLQPFINRV